MTSIFIGYPVGHKAYKLFDLSTKKVFTSRDVKFHEDIFPYVSLKPNSTLPSLTHNSGPIPLVAHDIPFSLDSFFYSTSHAPSSLLSNHTSTPYSTIENNDLPSHFRPSELVPSSLVLVPAPPSILRTYTQRPKPSSLPNNPTLIELSSQIDPNPPPSPSATPASPFPIPPSASILSTSPVEMPFFNHKHTHLNQLLCFVAPTAISPRQSSSTIMFAPTFALINRLP